MAWTRRRLLSRSAQAALAGVVLAPARCGPLGDRPEPPQATGSPAPPDPLLPLLAAERELLHRYDHVLGRFPQLAELAYVRADHDVHITALRAIVRGAEPSPTPAPTFAPATAAAAVAALRVAETAAAARYGSACVAAPASRAALLGSIAACESSHLVLLR